MMSISEYLCFFDKFKIWFWVKLFLRFVQPVTIVCHAESFPNLPQTYCTSTRESRYAYAEASKKSDMRHQSIGGDVLPVDLLDSAFTEMFEPIPLQQTTLYFFKVGTTSMQVDRCLATVLYSNHAHSLLGTSTMVLGLTTYAFCVWTLNYNSSSPKPKSHDPKSLRGHFSAGSCRQFLYI